MSGCFALSRSSSWPSARCAASSRCAGGALAGSARRRVAGLTRRRPTARRGLGLGRRLAVQALENQLAIAVPRQRLHRGLERELGVLDRLHVGLHLRRQAAGVALAELLELLLLGLEARAGVGHLRLEERARLLGLRAALARVGVDEEAGQALHDLLRGGAVLVVERDAERLGVAFAPGRARRGDRLDADARRHLRDDVLHRHRASLRREQVEVGDQLLELRAAEHLLGDRPQTVFDAFGDRGADVALGHPLRHDLDQREGSIEARRPARVQQAAEQTDDAPAR